MQMCFGKSKIFLCTVRGGVTCGEVGPICCNWVASVDEFTPRCIGHLPTHVLLSALVFFSNQNNSTRLLPLDGAIELLSSCKGTCQPY